MPYSNIGRIIGGWTKNKRVTATTANAVYAGDFLVLVSNKAIPASTLSDAGTKAQNQEAAHDIFLGVAVDAKLANVAADVLVASAGEMKYPCDALGSASDIGAFVGMAGTGSAGAVGVADQKVEIVATANLAIGKLSRPAATGATELYFELAPAVTSPSGGTQAFA